MGNKTELQRNVIQTKRFGNLLFVEGEREQDGITPRKETHVYTPEGKYLTFVKAYWWDKDALLKALENEHTQDIIQEKMESNRQNTQDKVQTAVEAIAKLNNDSLLEEAETLLENVKNHLKTC